MSKTTFMFSCCLATVMFRGTPCISFVKTYRDIYTNIFYPLNIQRYIYKHILSFKQGYIYKHILSFKQRYIYKHILSFKQRYIYKHILSFKQRYIYKHILSFKQRYIYKHIPSFKQRYIYKYILSFKRDCRQLTLSLSFRVSCPIHNGTI